MISVKSYRAIIFQNWLPLRLTFLTILNLIKVFQKVFLKEEKLKFCLAATLLPTFSKNANYQGLTLTYFQPRIRNSIRSVYRFISVIAKMVFSLISVLSLIWYQNPTNRDDIQIFFSFSILNAVYFSSPNPTQICYQIIQVNQLSIKIYIWYHVYQNVTVITLVFLYWRHILWLPLTFKQLRTTVLHSISHKVLQFWGHY